MADRKDEADTNSKHDPYADSILDRLLNHWWLLGPITGAAIYTYWALSGDDLNVLVIIASPLVGSLLGFFVGYVAMIAIMVCLLVFTEVYEALRARGLNVILAAAIAVVSALRAAIAIG